MKLFLNFSFVLILVVACHSQAKSPESIGRKNAAQPTIYLTLEKTDFAVPVGSERKTFSPLISSPSKAQENLGQVAVAESVVRLRLRNNSSWAIRVREQSASYIDQISESTKLRLSDGSYVSGLIPNGNYNLCFGREVETEDRNSPDAPVAFYSTHLCRRSLWLASGESLLLTIPRNLLVQKAVIFVEYNYEWEREKTDPEEGEIKANEPRHRVLFRESYLRGDRLKSSQ